jgi:hypothetical protein
MNFTGIRWYIFARQAAPCSFFTLGLGWSSLTRTRDAAVFNFVAGGTPNLPAATLGIGYELQSRQIIGLYVSGGHQGDLGLVNFSILFTLMGY